MNEHKSLDNFRKAVNAAMKMDPKSSQEKLIRYYEEREYTLHQVSGFSTNQLIELFAAGCTLEPPKKAEPIFREPVMRNIP